MNKFNYQSVVCLRGFVFEDNLRMLNFLSETIKDPVQYNVDVLNSDEFETLASNDIMLVEFEHARHKTLFDLRWGTVYHIFEKVKEADAHYERERQELLDSLSRMTEEYIRASRVPTNLLGKNNV